jgi:Cu/Ag efflux pump CusA
MFRPMAIALIGGLCVGTILTLVVIPTLYDMVLNRNIKKLKK